MKQVGTVTHYYGKIGVAIVKLSGSLKVGDKIKVEDGNASFEQTVDSIQIEHEQIEKAKKGDVVGLRVSEAVSEDAIVSLL